MIDLEELKSAVASGKRVEATGIVEAAIASGAEPAELLSAMVAAMDDVGARFQCGEAFIPEMLLASRAMSASLELLEPLLVQSGLTPDVTVVIGTVEGDLHDIGKNLVAMMWKGANFQVIDLGTNVSPGTFVAAAREHGARLVGLSALLTTTMPAMKRTVSAFKEAGLDDVKLVLGGAPITHEFVAHVGGDGYAPDAAGAVSLARQLLSA